MPVPLWALAAVAGMALGGGGGTTQSVSTTANLVNSTSPTTIVTIDGYTESGVGSYLDNVADSDSRATTETPKTSTSPFGLGAGVEAGGDPQIYAAGVSGSFFSNPMFLVGLAAAGAFAVYKLRASAG